MYRSTVALSRVRIYTQHVAAGAGVAVSELAGRPYGAYTASTSWSGVTPARSAVYGEVGRGTMPESRDELYNSIGHRGIHPDARERHRARVY